MYLLFLTEEDEEKDLLLGIPNVLLSKICHTIKFFKKKIEEEKKKESSFMHEGEKKSQKDTSFLHVELKKLYMMKYGTSTTDVAII